MNGWLFTGCSLVIAAIAFAGIAPTLTSLDFNNGSENLVVETVLEMHRGGPWAIPNYNGVPRTTKPPLANWICAAFVRPSTVSELSSVEHRAAAYQRLAWEVRWHSLGFGCLTLVVVAWMGRILISDATGFVAAAMMASSVMFLRHSRWTTTDLQLAFWVAVANTSFSLALFRNRRWLGCLVGGVGVGLALMSKGPVALAQTVAPLAVFLAWRSWKKPKMSGEFPGWMPLLGALIVALAVAVPWPVWAAIHLPGELTLWWNQVVLGGREDYGWDPWWSYLSFFVLILPWVIFFVLGVLVWFQERTDRGLLALLYVLVPIAIMSCFKQKNERYLLPMLGPACVVCALGFVSRIKGLEQFRKSSISLTWVMLAAIAIGLPFAGALFLHRSAGGEWWSMRTAALAASANLLILATGWFIDRSHEFSLIPAALALMITSEALFIHGYKASWSGTSAGKPLADIIAVDAPADAEVWCYATPERFQRVPSDIPIYLNRIVRNARQATTLPSTGTPQIVFVHCRPGQSIPEELRGWHVLGSFEENQGIWSALMQPSP